MFKKIFLVASVFLTVGIINTSAHASNNDIQLISPHNKTITTNNVILVSGRGRQGTDLTIDAYLANTFSNRIDFNNIPKEGYVLIVSEDLKIGASGSFAKELALKSGLNKIEVKVVNGTDSSNKAVRYIYITDLNKARREIQSINDLRFTETLKQLID